MTAEQWMTAARKRQGLPPTIKNQVVLARLAALVRAALERPSSAQVSPPD